jgi:hypothetical protein
LVTVLHHSTTHHISLCTLSWVFLCPSLFWETFLLGTGFEIYEYIALDCADPMDIVYNVLGFVIGQSLSEYVT